MFRFTLIVAASVIVLGCNSDSPSSGAVTLESFNSVLTSTSVRSASLDCPTGGVTLDAGIDENGNGQLDASEVDLSQDVCNGADGTDGTDGTDGSSVLVSVSPENAGKNCAAGGTRIDSGLDIDSSLTLNTAEITATGYICSGLDGTNGTDGTAGTNGLTMLIAVSNEAAGDMCSVGGKKLVSGPDTNANGSLEPAEVSQTTYVCDGANWWDALGSTGSVTGQVLREEGSPAIGAEVFIEGTEHYTYADGFGRYRFDKVQVGQKRLQINYEGYRSQLLPMLPVTHGNTLAARTVRLSKNRAPLAGTQSLYSFAALASPTSYGASGQSVASAGDVNGDGVADLLIGAHGVDETYLIYGRPGIDLNALASLKPDVTFTSTPAKGNSGQSVASAGDVNGDGFADLLILDPNVGETHLIYGSADLSASFDLGDADVTFTGQPKGKDGLYTSLASAGDVNGDGFADLLIGAPNAASRAGETYLIYGSAALNRTIAVDNADVTFTGKAASDSSGESVASAGDVNGDGFADLLIGASHADPGSISNAGETYLIYGSAGLSGTMALVDADATFTGKAEGDYSGRWLASAGDVNGDGFADLLIGASGTVNGGETYLVMGAPRAIRSTANILKGTRSVASGLTFTGSSVASAGDVNGDGFADLLIGVPGAGETYLIYGRSGIYLNALASLKPDVTFTGNSSHSMASAGDVNGDGFADLLILDPNEGETHLIYGSADLSASFDLGEADVTFTGQSTGKAGYYYNSMASAGDVNGDGFADLLIGDAGTWAGETYLIYGSAGLSGTMALVEADVTFTGRAERDDSGRWVASAGDVNGDGFADLLIGAPGADPGSIRNAGETYLIYGSAGLSGAFALVDADVTFTGKAESDFSGHSVASAGDVNGDGFADLLIGAIEADPGSISNAGETYLIYGSAGLSGTMALVDADVTFTGKAERDYSGRWLASAGDVNGDGFADVLIGAFGAANAGETYLIFGMGNR